MTRRAGGKGAGPPSWIGLLGADVGRQVCRDDVLVEGEDLRVAWVDGGATQWFWLEPKVCTRVKLSITLPAASVNGLSITSVWLSPLTSTIGPGKVSASWASFFLVSAKCAVGSAVAHMSAWITIRTALAWAWVAAAKESSSQARFAALRAVYSAASPSICAPPASNCGALLSLPVTLRPTYQTAPWVHRRFSG
jgi:hypothetical protein